MREAAEKAKADKYPTVSRPLPGAITVLSWQLEGYD
jgi:hypothetical protein